MAEKKEAKQILDILREKGPVGETVMDINTRLRFSFDLYANIRPAKSYPVICPPALRPDIDVIVVRENAEGFYRAIENEVVPGIWTCAGVFTEKGARRIADFSFRYLATNKRRRDATLALATKANIFRKTHGLYLSVFKEVAQNYPEIRFEHYYADALCARLVRDPQKYDMIVSENLIADLLSDLAGQIAGGLGMTPATNINYETKHAYFEPTHGCAPDIAGKNIANPIGLIRAGALMLEYLGMVNNDPKLNEASHSIESAVETLLNSNDKLILPFEIGGRANATKVAET
jgi:3-isopropylmalate dehydrogenase